MTKHERAAKQTLWAMKTKHKFTFSFRHVKGHTDRPEARFVTNNLCDMRAKQAMRLARKRFGFTVKGKRT